MKPALILTALLLAGSANAQNNMGAHPDMRPDRSRAGTLSYAEHEQKLAKCMVDLATITDPGLRRWCEAQSRRLP